MIQNEVEALTGSFWNLEKVLGYENLILGSFGDQNLT
jgi:hypothetical protein